MLSEIYPAPAAIFHVWLEKVDTYFYASNLSGFGPLWFILFLPGIVFSFFYSLFKKKYDFVFIVLAVFLVFAVHPRNWYPRYVIFLFGTGCLAFGIMADYFKKRGKILQFLALLLVIYTVFTSNSFCITPEKIKDFVFLPYEERTLARMEPCVVDETQNGNYGLWDWIDKNVSEGETFVYTSRPQFVAPFWNRGFSNKVIFVKKEKFSDWLSELKANDATYVLVTPRTIEYWWIARVVKLKHIPEWAEIYNSFKIVYSDSNNAVLRFR